MNNLTKQRESIMPLATKFKAAIDLIGLHHPGTVAYCVTPQHVELLNPMGAVTEYISHEKLLEYWQVINSEMIQ